MKQTKAVSAIVLALLAIFQNGLAQRFGDQIAKYLPYREGRPWPTLSVDTYFQSNSNTWAHPYHAGPTMTVEESEGADSPAIILTCQDGRSFKTHCSEPPSPFPKETYSGDFNQDGKPDVLMIVPGSGCGLAAGFCTGIFAFSDGDHYRFAQIGTMGLGTNSLIIDPVSNGFRFIHTSFRTALCTDKRIHSFWVHRFFAWNGTGFELDSSKPPIWIQYLNRPNHQPTKLLTPSLKAKAWAKPTSDTSVGW